MENSARTRGIKDCLATVETVPTMASHGGVVPPCPHMPVTPVHGGSAAHDEFHFSSTVSSLEQNFDGLDYDLDNLIAGTNVCDQLYESMSKVTLIFY